MRLFTERHNLALWDFGCIFSSPPLFFFSAARNCLRITWCWSLSTETFRDRANMYDLKGHKSCEQIYCSPATILWSPRDTKYSHLGIFFCSHIFPFTLVAKVFIFTTNIVNNSSNYPQGSLIWKDNRWANSIVNLLCRSLFQCVFLVSFLTAHVCPGWTDFALTI